MSIIVETPFQNFTGLDGKPLTNGKVYIGQVGTDPTVFANQIPVFWDEALTIPAAQPLTTSAGYIVRTGTPSRVYVATNYSISVKNSSNILVYYLADFGVVQYALESEFDDLSNSISLPDYAALRAYSGNRKNVYLTGYLVGNKPDGIAGPFTINEGAISDDGGVFISGAKSWKRQYKGSVDVRWWGAKFDSVTDDTASVQACINYAQPLQLGIELPAGISKITSTLTAPTAALGLNMSGQGYRKTQFNYSAIGSGLQALIIRGGSGTLCGADINGVGFIGNANSIAVEIRGTCGQFLTNCEFGVNNIGVLFHNFASGDFTEHNKVSGCNFTIDCKTVMYYKVSAGAASFHGSGLINKCTINTPLAATQSSIIVEATAFPYNCPIDAHFWVNSTITVIQSLNGGGTYRPYFTGAMTFEIFSGIATIASAPTTTDVPFVGTIASVSNSIRYGALFTCDAIFNNTIGSRQTIGAKYNVSVALTTGANTISGSPYNITEGSILYAVRIVGPNYDYRYWVGTYKQQTGGLAPIVATFSTFNSAGWGAPTFSMDASNNLIITNASYPASGVTATIEAMQMSQSISTPLVY